MQSTLDSSSELVKPSRAPDLAPQRQRLLELGLDLWPRLRAPARTEHDPDDAVDAEPRVPEAGGGVGFLSLWSPPRGRRRAPRPPPPPPPARVGAPVSRVPL